MMLNIRTFYWCRYSTVSLSAFCPEIRLKDTILFFIQMTLNVFLLYTLVSVRTQKLRSVIILFVLVFVLRLNVPVNSFQSCWDGATASWVLPVLSGT